MIFRREILVVYIFILLCDINMNVLKRDSLIALGVAVLWFLVVMILLVIQERKLPVS